METRCRITTGGGDPRESATESKPPRTGAAARVKGWGKSPPRDWQQERHGKPHREQDRIGMTRGATLRAVSGPVIRVGCVRRMATCVQDEWSPRSCAARCEGHTEPGLQAGWHLLPTETEQEFPGLAPARNGIARCHAVRGRSGGFMRRLGCTADSPVWRVFGERWINGPAHI